MDTGGHRGCVCDVRSRHVAVGLKVSAEHPRPIELLRNRREPLRHNDSSGYYEEMSGKRVSACRVVPPPGWRSARAAP